MSGVTPGVRYEVVDAIATITLDRPQKRNAMDQAMLYAVVDHVIAAEHDDRVKAILLQAEGPMFCSGFDLSGPDKFFGDGEGHRSAIAAMRDRAELMRRYLFTLKPTIAKVQGDCIGVGLYFVLLSDLAIVADNASFGLPEERFGAAGTSWIFTYLASQCGLKATNEIMLTGRRLSAAELASHGLVNRAVAADQLDHAVAELCRALRSLPRDGIATGRVTAHMAYEALGIAQSFTPHYALLPYVASMQRTPDEFDFHQAIAERGVREAVAERDRVFGGDYWRW